MKRYFLILNLSVFCSCMYAQNNQYILDHSFPPNTTNPQGNVGFSKNNSTTIDNSVWNYSPWWNHQWDENHVFKTELDHGDYSLRVGQGSQLYSIKTPIGEIAPKQNHHHAWVDDTWLMTAYVVDHEDTSHAYQGGPSHHSFIPFIHSCGMYGHQEPDTTNYKLPWDFWAPMLSEKWDPIDNSYSTVTLGLMSGGPSYNRGDLLMYQKIRDLGDGAFEIVYMTYDFNTSIEISNDPRFDWSPWGGVRTSKLPDALKTSPGGSYVVDNGGFNILRDVQNTDGWDAFTEDANDSTSYALGYVYGDSFPSEFNHQRFAFGRTGVWRDFTVAAMSIQHPNLAAGNLFFCRIYLVVGEQHEVIDRCKDLKSTVEEGILIHTQDSSTLVPIYLTNLSGQTVISSTGTIPAGYVFAEPVKDSKPLFLVKNNITNKYHVTSDPYMTMPRYPIPGTPHEGYRPYDGTTEIIELIGFAMPSVYADTTLHDYVALESVVTDTSYFTMNGIYDTNLVIVQTDVFAGLEKESSPICQIYPNPTNELLHLKFTTKSDKGPIKVIVKDMSGKVVKRRDYNNGMSEIDLNVSELTRGIYFLTIDFSSGEVFSEKFVKE